MKIIVVGKKMFTTIPHVTISFLRLCSVGDSKILVHSKSWTSNNNISKNFSSVQYVSRLYDHNQYSGFLCFLPADANFFGKYEYTAITRSVVYLTGSFLNRVITGDYTYTFTNKGKTTSIRQNYITYGDQCSKNNTESHSNVLKEPAYLSTVTSDLSKPEITNTFYIGVSEATNWTTTIISTRTEGS
jgi:hypothetical protein